MIEEIKQLAKEIGFDACGVAQADFLADDRAFLEKWIAAGNHAEMSYLERNMDLRTDPRKMVEGVKSIIVTLTNYYPQTLQNSNAPQISKYAYSKTDYHYSIKANMNRLKELIEEQFGKDCFNSEQQHIFVDSAPVLERRWAQRAGLGWIGKNKMLINPTLGSYCFIAILMINKSMPYYDEPMPDRCGTCTRCLQSCPTNAIQADRAIDAGKCISYQTIEKRGTIDQDIQSKLSGYIFGCDICNDVCPWNKTRAKANKSDQFSPIKELIHWDFNDWESFEKPQFKHLFKSSAIQRAGYKKLKENINILSANRTDKK